MECRNGLTDVSFILDRGMSIIVLEPIFWSIRTWSQSHHLLLSRLCIPYIIRRRALSSLVKHVGDQSDAHSDSFENNHRRWYTWHPGPVGSMQSANRTLINPAPWISSLDTVWTLLYPLAATFSAAWLSNPWAFCTAWGNPFKAKPIWG